MNRHQLPCPRLVKAGITISMLLATGATGVTAPATEAPVKPGPQVAATALSACVTNMAELRSRLGQATAPGTVSEDEKGMALEHIALAAGALKAMLAKGAGATLEEVLGRILGGVEAIDTTQKLLPPCTTQVIQTVAPEVAGAARQLDGEAAKALEGLVRVSGQPPSPAAWSALTACAHGVVPREFRTSGLLSLAPDLLVIGRRNWLYVYRDTSRMVLPVTQETKVVFTVATGDVASASGVMAPRVSLVFDGDQYVETPLFHPGSLRPRIPAPSDPLSTSPAGADSRLEILVDQRADPAGIPAEGAGGYATAKIAPDAVLLAEVLTLLGDSPPTNNVKNLTGRDDALGQCREYARLTGHPHLGGMVDRWQTELTAAVNSAGGQLKVELVGMPEEAQMGREINTTVRLHNLGSEPFGLRSRSCGNYANWRLSTNAILIVMKQCDEDAEVTDTIPPGATRDYPLALLVPKAKDTAPVRFRIAPEALAGVQSPLYTVQVIK